MRSRALFVRAWAAARCAYAAKHILNGLSESPARVVGSARSIVLRARICVSCGACFDVGHPGSR
eukprot:11223426-Lingulodinium_polyedra.AAC.1